MKLKDAAIYRYRNIKTIAEEIAKELEITRPEAFMLMQIELLLNIEEMQDASPQRRTPPQGDAQPLRI